MSSKTKFSLIFITIFVLINISFANLDHDEQDIILSRQKRKLIFPQFTTMQVGEKLKKNFNLILMLDFFSIKSCRWRWLTKFLTLQATDLQ
jgi:hypothetical protein